jgi:hypothetical protein
MRSTPPWGPPRCSQHTTGPQPQQQEQPGPASQHLMKIATAMAARVQLLSAKVSCSSGRAQQRQRQLLQQRQVAGGPGRVGHVAAVVVEVWRAWPRV